MVDIKNIVLYIILGLILVGIGYTIFNIYQQTALSTYKKTDATYEGCLGDKDWLEKNYPTFECGECQLRCPDSWKTEMVIFGTAGEGAYVERSKYKNEGCEIGGGYGNTAEYVVSCTPPDTEEIVKTACGEETSPGTWRVSTAEGSYSNKDVLNLNSLDRVISVKDNCNDAEVCKQLDHMTAECVAEEEQCVTITENECNMEGGRFVVYFDTCGNIVQSIKTCSEDEYCLNGYCVVYEESDDTGYTYDDTTLDDLNLPTSCVSDSDCGSGYTCENSECALSDTDTGLICFSDDECGAGYSCNLYGACTLNNAETLSPEDEQLANQTVLIGLVIVFVIIFGTVIYRRKFK